MTLTNRNSNSMRKSFSRSSLLTIDEFNNNTNDDDEACLLPKLLSSSVSEYKSPPPQSLSQSFSLPSSDVDLPLQRPYSLRDLPSWSDTLPISVGCFPKMHVDERVLNLMVKSNTGGADQVMGVPNFAQEMVQNCLAFCEEHRIPIENRYMFLTTDRKTISEVGTTLRTPGWHLDGLQGDEVTMKQPGDFQFVWSDCFQTEFCPEAFITNGIDMSRDNVNTRLEEQIDNDYEGYSANSYELVLMHCYHVHRSRPLPANTTRQFFRLSFSCTPITARNMTVNPAMEYNYPIHTTTGKVPAHLS